jgi:predicted transcriptional regulator
MSGISDLSESARLRSVRVPMKTYGGRVLVTREKGARARFDIERQLAAIGSGDVVALDFRGVAVVSVPFADECVAGLLSGRLTGYYEEHPVVAINANEDVRETVALTLRARRLALLCIGPERPELLGGDRILNETLQAAWELKRFSAAELGERLGLSPQAANNRLSALVNTGAVHRVRVVPTGGGKEFAYEVVRSVGSGGANGSGSPRPRSKSRTPA